MNFPTPETLQLKTKTVVICPKCGIYIMLRARKKDKTHSGLEYRRHYTQNHS